MYQKFFKRKSESRGVIVPLFLSLFLANLLFPILSTEAQIIPPPASGGRLWSSGCELQGDAPGNMIDDLEFDRDGSSADTTQISAVVKRSGLSSCMSAQTTTGWSKFSHQYRTLPTYDRVFLRFNLYIGTLPAHDASIAAIGGTQQTLVLNANGTLRLLDADGVTTLGTYGTPLVTGQWYRIEWMVDSRTPLPSDAEVRVNGQTVITTSTAGMLTHGTVDFGLCFTNFTSICNGNSKTTGTLYFDDMALNEGTGTYQNSWPGAGYIVHLQPNGASSSGSGSGNDCSSGDWSSIDEITPDDNATRCVLSGNVKVLRAEVESPTSAGIDPAATISVVQVGVREAAASAASESWRLFLRPDSSASNTYGSTVTHNDTTYRTNGDNTPRNYQLNSYTNPSLSMPWTRANLDSLIIGLETVDGSPAVHLSTLWALVEYRVPVTVTLDASPTSVEPGEPSTLTWSSQAGTWYCTMSGLPGILSPSGSEDVVPTISTIYSITCEGPGGSGSDIAVVTVVPPGSSGSFVEPTGGPYGERTNAGKYLNTGGLFQEKGASLSGASGPGLGMDLFVAVKTLCLGTSNCISDWWPTLTRPTTCKLEVRRVRGGSTSFGSVLKTSGCDARLSIPALQAGWVSTGVDYCDDGLCNSSTIAGCVYTRMVCTGGVTVNTPPVSTILTHPVANFTFTPACNDGVDNDGTGGTDFPNDPQCSTFADNDESS